MDNQQQSDEITPRSFFNSLFMGKNGIYSAIFISLAISLILMFIFKNRMFLLIIPLFPIQIIYRKIKEFFSGRKKNRLG